MTIRVGDSVFVRSGTPTVVRDRDGATGKLKLDEAYGQVQRDMRHGYINGMEPETRQRLYEILDEVKGASADPRERVEAMSAKLGEIESDPTQLPLTRYLRAEMLHIMNTHGIKPKEYSVNEIKTR